MHYQWGEKLEKWFNEDVAAIRRLPGYHDFQPPKPFRSIRWSVKPKRCAKAGVCWSNPGQEKIWLNGYMTEAHARSTFKHELAHLFANRCDQDGPRNEGHGPIFKRWARAMGDDGGRCHNYPELMAIKRGTWAHCLGCRRDVKKCWRRGDPTLYTCRICGKGFVPGQATPEKRFAVAMAAHGPTPDFNSVESIQLLKLTLQSLHEAGMASSPEAKRCRRQLRALGHTGGCRG